MRAGSSPSQGESNLARDSDFLARLGTDEVSGVTVTKFQLDDDVFANGTVCNENSCYENNLPTGVQVFLTRVFPKSAHLLFLRM